jgi:hypothetical protein
LAGGIEEKSVDGRESLIATADAESSVAEEELSGPRQWYLVAVVNKLGRYEQVSVISQRQYQHIRNRPDILLLDRFHTIADAREAEERLRVVYGEEVTSRLDGQAPKRAAAAAG